METDDEPIDEAQVRLQEVLSPSSTQFQYTYDFGDGWEHQIQIEPEQPAQAATQYPVCTAGERNCPPEDCGGVPGFENLLAVLHNKTHPARDQWLNWLGGAYNPDSFNLTTINRQLAKRFL
ncbi:plasmid pRiA4b ORF-3 family protein [Fibrivirga algicola]|uniref:plasmid pRiA4b ORF-3 family protein n=1 Tax=Fibrivirga algicola TaxID=2950420 RepID=UPI00141A32DC|nr:plasmid pRiA4b ORF-3 family protein [Fibrivirga algicola]